MVRHGVIAHQLKVSIQPIFGRCRIACRPLHPHTRYVEQHQLVLVDVGNSIPAAAGCITNVESSVSTPNSVGKMHARTLSCSRVVKTIVDEGSKSSQASEGIRMFQVDHDTDFFFA
jgi:hypothetical protein